MSGIKGLNSVKIEVTWKSILTLGCCDFSLETFAFFKNSLKTNKKIILQELSQVVVEQHWKTCLYLFPEVLKIDTRIQDMQHTLNIADDLNRNGSLYENFLLVGFDVVNMFFSTGNKMESKLVKNILLNRNDYTPPVECIIEALELCLNCNNSIF